MAAVRFILFGFRPRRASHLDRSPSSHSHRYACSADRPTCFAQHAQIPEPFMQQAGNPNRAPASNAPVARLRPTAAMDCSGGRALEHYPPFMLGVAGFSRLKRGHATGAVTNVSKFHR